MEGYVLTELKVLVVEKQLFMRRLLGDVLTQLGMTKVVKVPTIAQALAIVAKNDVDLVLLDWAPDMDALGFLTTVRDAKESRDPFIPVIVVTAYSEYAHVCKARDAGMTEYLTKPISAKGLYNRIRSIIERNRNFVRTNNFFGPDRRRKRMENLPEERRQYKPEVLHVNKA
ncbi:MAG: response regulator [Magnetovibrio sp.]|nr:response regulator [Magnetovibrio sp.]